MASRTFVTDNTIEFSSRYFKLAGFKEFVHGDMLEYYEKYLSTNQLLIPYNYGIYFTDERKIKAINFNNTGNIKALRFFPDSLDYSKFINKIRKEAR